VTALAVKATSHKRSLRERTPLRTQLVVVTLALATATVVVVALLSAWLLRGYLYNQVDDALVSSVQSLSHGPSGGPGTPMHGPGGLIPPVAYFGQVYDADGRVLSNFGPTPGSTTNAPNLPTFDSATVAAHEGKPFTVSGEGGESWRVLVTSVADSPMTGPGTNSGAAAVAIGVPLQGVQQTWLRLLVVDAVVALLALLALAVVARWVVAASLRPLADIEQTAHAIAAGDLAKRVDNDIPDTEVGSLGASLNVMLERIENAFVRQRKSEAAAKDSEQQMRRFVADASHELRTPLTAIRGYAELYRQGAVAEPGEVADAMRRIEQTAVRMGLLVEDLLLLARLDQQRPLTQTQVPLDRVVSDVGTDLRPLAGHHTLTMSGSDVPVTVTGDPERLRQVFTNLISNALQHTPAGTSVTVTIGSAEPGWASVEVADDGPGMTQEQADHAFDRFYRVEASRSRGQSTQGSGLGLAIVDALVRAHGGRVELTTSPGQGTRVRVTLPVAYEQ
jgi:two-component system, OmpR family, sensor kinase